MLQRDGVETVEMMVLAVEMVMMMVLMMKVMVMMIPMKSSSTVVTMAMISPSPGGISPADFCLPESFSLSGVFHPAEAAVFISEPPLDLGFWG